jgi:hypothetical protein
MGNLLYLVAVVLVILVAVGYLGYGWRVHTHPSGYSLNCRII